MQVKKIKKNALDIIEMNIFVIVCLCVYVYTRMFVWDRMRVCACVRLKHTSLHNVFFLNRLLRRMIKRGHFIIQSDFSFFLWTECVNVNACVQEELCVLLLL